MEEKFVAILEENIDKLQNVMRFEHDELVRIYRGFHPNCSYEKDLSHSMVQCSAEIRKTIELLQAYKGIDLTLGLEKEALHEELKKEIEANINRIKNRFDKSIRN